MGPSRRACVKVKDRDSRFRKGNEAKIETSELVYFDFSINCWTTLSHLLIKSSCNVRCSGTVRYPSDEHPSRKSRKICTEDSRERENWGKLLNYSRVKITGATEFNVQLTRIRLAKKSIWHLIMRVRLTEINYTLFHGWQLESALKLTVPHGSAS